MFLKYFVCIRSLPLPRNQKHDATILPLQNKPGTTAKEGSPTHGMHSFCFCIFVILSFLFFVVSVFKYSPYLWRHRFAMKGNVRDIHASRVGLFFRVLFTLQNEQFFHALIYFCLNSHVTIPYILTVSAVG